MKSRGSDSNRVVAPVLSTLFVPCVDNVGNLMYVTLRREHSLKYSAPPVAPRTTLCRPLVPTRRLTTRHIPHPCRTIDLPHLKSLERFRCIACVLSNPGVGGEFSSFVPSMQHVIPSHCRLPFRGHRSLPRVPRDADYYLCVGGCADVGIQELGHVVLRLFHRRWRPSLRSARTNTHTETGELLSGSFHGSGGRSGFRRNPGQLSPHGTPHR